MQNAARFAAFGSSAWGEQSTAGYKSCKNTRRMEASPYCAYKAQLGLFGMGRRSEKMRSWCALLPPTKNVSLPAHLTSNILLANIVLGASMFGVGFGNAVFDTIQAMERT